MNMKKHFETATEKFEFTVLIDTLRGRKKVLEFVPKDPQDDLSYTFVTDGITFGDHMIVNQITKGGLRLFSFDILDRKTTIKIKFEDVELGNTLDK